MLYENPTTKTPELRLFGKLFLTDHEGLTEFFTPPWHRSKEVIEGRHKTVDELDAAFPGFSAAVLTCMKDLDKRQLPCDKITFFFGEVKAWPHESFWVQGPSVTVNWENPPREDLPTTH